MAAFFEDPRLRQRWNQLSHNAETVTENAAAGIWTFQHTYVTPCLAGLGEAVDTCTSICVGDREERARRQRERARGAHRSLAEYSFDFYDDWYDDDYDDRLTSDGVQNDCGDTGGASDINSTGRIFGAGFFGSWHGIRAEDWDRLLAGSGPTGGRCGNVEGCISGGNVGDPDGDSAGRVAGEYVEQPRRRHDMNYNTRTPRRKLLDSHGGSTTIIANSGPLGLLSRLPSRLGVGTLRYKPSAANLRKHPPGSSLGSRYNLDGRDGRDATVGTADEHEPLLGSTNYEGAVTHHDQYGGADDDRGIQQQQLPQREEQGGLAATDRVEMTTSRGRSGTTGSGDTSDSFRSRGDLFPSDEEDDEDAVPLDDEFAVTFDRVPDDRSSGGGLTRLSNSSNSTSSLPQIVAGRRKGKTRADTAPSTKSVLSRSVSHTTVGSAKSLSPSTQRPAQSPAALLKKSSSDLSLPEGIVTEAKEVDEAARPELGPVLTTSSLETSSEEAGDRPELAKAQPLTTSLAAGRLSSLKQVNLEEANTAREEDVDSEHKPRVAARLARERGFASEAAVSIKGGTAMVGSHHGHSLDPLNQYDAASGHSMGPRKEFVPARLPRF
ncbi:hypothetical protein SPI_09178 [Niveomyces insectorum RCEF 264]|uniref:Uncharacterized protein n=1 Tax=Niveomyces insectorum RCEF 264 TaxID=1081102 RepID=A0A167M5Y4_9HYPO|nr:hypothetical protein SPI_09178 [Niveomyces insectorum RCEF 264]